MGTVLNPGVVPLSGQGLSGQGMNPVRTVAPSVAQNAGQMLDIGAAGMELFVAAENESAMAEARADTTARLSGLAGDLEFETDHNALGAKWQEGVSALEREYEEKLGAGSNAYNTWREYFLQKSTQMGIGIQRRQRDIIVDKGTAALVRELDAERDGLKFARTPEEYGQAKQRGIEAIQRKVEIGILSDTAGAQKRIEWEDGVDKVQAEQEHEARMQGVYQFLHENFKDRGDAVEFLEDSRNQRELGLTLNEALKFVDIMDAEDKRNQEERDEAEAAALKREREELYGLIQGKDYSGAMGFLARAQYLPAEEKMKLEDAVKGRKWSDDPDTVARLRSGIWSGNIRDKGDLVRHLGHGLSVNTMNTMREDIDKLNPESKPAGDGINYFDMAVQRFRKQFKDNPAVLEQEARFTASLTHMARGAGTMPEDPAMIKLADDLLEPYGDDYSGWYNPADWFEEEWDSKFEYMLEKGEFNYENSSTPQAVPPKTVQAQRVPSDAYKLIKGQLAASGKDSSDDSIYKVYVANKDKFKGAE